MASSQYIQHSLLDFSWTVYHAHNGFLHVASEIGLPLAIIGVLMVFQQLIEVIYCQYQQQQSGTLFVLAFTVALLLSNYSEARFLVNREMYWIFFIAMPISMLRQVSVVMRDGQHNPISIPLNDKQRFKAFNLVDIRIRNRAMKTRLKDIRNVLADTKSKPPQPQVFDGQVTSRRSNR